MYKIGDLIIYGNYGVCRVEEVGVPDLQGFGEDRTYYTLSPIYHDGKIFTPVDSGVFMRPVISYEEAQKLISVIPTIREYDSDYKNIKLMEGNYKESLQTHKCSDLIKIIKTIYTKKVITVGQGKKLGQIDERFMKKAEDLLYGEFAVALGMPLENVKGYVEERVKELVEN